MRQAMLASVGILLLIVGLVIGWFAGTESRSVTNPEGDGNAQFKDPELETIAPGIRYRAGDPGLLAPPPSWEEWKYPDSRVHKAGNAGKAWIGKIEVGALDQVALVSKDDFDKVWKFYRDKVEHKVAAAGRTPLARQNYEWHGAKKILTVTINDRPYACAIEGPETDLVQARGFWVQSLHYKLAGFIYRAKGSDATDILLFYYPSNEVIELLKERLVKE